MIKYLKMRFRREQFDPSFCGLFVNPFYFSRKGLHDNIALLSGTIAGRILDVGCGQKPYIDLFHYTQYIGLELDTAENRRSKNADYYYDGTNFPFQECEFDGIVVNEVFEHVFNPVQFLKEANRVLKPGGTVLMTVPFCWDEHEQPHDFARYTSFGLISVVEAHGFKVIAHRKSMNDVRVIFQLINGYLYKKTVTTNSYVNLLITILLIAPFNMLGTFLSKVLPRNNDLYLDNTIVAQKIRGNVYDITSTGNQILSNDDLGFTGSTMARG